MADFIEVTELSLFDGRTVESKRWISKFHILKIEADVRHGQTFIFYSDKSEIIVKETVSEILEGFQE